MREAETALEPELPIVDPHHHLWEDSHLGLKGPYLLPQVTADVTAGHNIRATVFIEATDHYRTHGPEALRPVGETEYANATAQLSAASEARGHRICAAIVAHADLTLGDALDDVLLAHRQVAPDRLRGIRHIVCPTGMGKNYGDADRLLLREDFRAGLKRLTAHDLSFEIMAFHFQLEEVIDTVRALPEVRFVLNHIGVPLGVGPYAGKQREVFEHWAASIAVLGKEPNVVAKLGGLGMPVMGFEWQRNQSKPGSAVLAQSFQPYFDHVIESFSPARCMFESNFPPDAASGNYVEIWNSYKLASRHYSATERAQMFHDNAFNFYRL